MWNEALEDLIVVKRSGQRVEFNASKIAIAIKNAFDSVEKEPDEKNIYRVFEKVLNYLNENYQNRKTINVEDIQDVIETKLKSENFINVYNSFREYRQKRAASRKVFVEKQQHKFVKAIEKVYEENNLKTNEYLNPYLTLTKYGSIVSSEYNKSYIIDNKFIKAIEEGNLYIHNLDYYPLGFIPQVNLKFNKNYNDEYYLDEMLSTILSAQNEVNKEIGINSIDSLLSPLVLKIYKDILLKNTLKYLNVCGYKEFINNKRLEEQIFKESSLSIDLNNYKHLILNNNIKNIFEISFKDSYQELIEYVETTLFKLLNTLENNNYANIIYTISLGSNKKDIGLLITDTIINILKTNPKFAKVHILFKLNQTKEDLITKVSELILNKKNISLSLGSNNENIEYFSDGTKIYENINDNINISTGRMNVGSSSINLARLGLKYKNKKIKEFYNELEQILELAKNELLLNFETLGNKNSANYQTLFKGNIYQDEKLEGNQKIRKVLKNGTLNLGVIGLKECIISLETIEDKQYNLLIKILEFINDYISRIKEETKLNIGLYEPSDIKCRKELIAVDKSIYGTNKNITDKNYYELIDSLKILSNDYNKLSKIKKYFVNGSKTTINLANNVTSKKIIELIKKLIDLDIGNINFKVGKE